MFLTELLGRNLSLPASSLVACGQPRLFTLTKEPAVCLWLAAFRGQTAGLAGLWGLWLDVYSSDRDGPRAPSCESLPKVIRETFQPQGKPGEEQSFFRAVQVCMNACYTSGTRLQALAQPVLGDDPSNTVVNIGRLQQRLFDGDDPEAGSGLTVELSDGELAAVRSLVRLCCSLPAGAWRGIPPDPLWLQTLDNSGDRWADHEVESFDRLLECLRSVPDGFRDSHTSAIVGWVLSVFIERLDPMEAALECAQPRNKLEKKVNVYLLRASNTLLDGFLRRAYACIDR